MNSIMKNVSFLRSCCHLLGVFFLLFSDLCFASLVKGGPGPNKVQKDRKTIKKGTQKGPHFHKNSEIFALCFPLIFGGVLGNVFSRFGGRSVPNGSHLRVLFQPCCGKAGKLKTRVSCRPNTTFPSFEGLGQEVLGNLFSRSFLRRVLRRDLTIC